jgi:hypothetical protein
MSCFPRLLIVSSFFLLTCYVFSFEVKAQDVTTVNQRIAFSRGADSAIIKKQIRKGTSHQYRILVRAGQNMMVGLRTGKQTSFTVYAPAKGIIEGANGQINWGGMLSKTGEYIIVIGTNATANYTLKVYIK